MFIPFFAAANLVESSMEEMRPWDFNISEAENWPKKMKKAERRRALLNTTAVWNCYSAFRGFAPNLIVSKTNPAAGLRGIVVDYDAISSIETVLGYLEQMPESLRPNFVEISLSNKIRLVWVFEREVLTPSTEFATELLKTFFAKLGIPTLLPGYDAAGSLKPTERWTNGAIWYSVKEEPLPWVYCFGVTCEVSKKSKLFEQSTIPLQTIADEVQKRWPGRWQGDFALNALGQRFWDETADNPTGCQVKPDGMLCFTGKEPFVKWESLFGTDWVETQKILNLGAAGEGIFFDGKGYWEQSAMGWVQIQRTDIILRLKGRGLSDITAKGETQSDVERVLDHIQQHNRIAGAAPFINYEPGLLEVGGQRFLNVANLATTTPISGTGDPDKDFPFIASFIKGLFARPELGPLDHFLTWLKFGHHAFLNYERHVGQAIFLCGPKNNGKTLLCDRIVAPLLGNRTANPMEYLTGNTAFNDELFHSGLLSINDEDAPRSDGERSKMLARLKSFVVNPSHTYHPKFLSRVTIYWTGRVFVTLNDDPSSVGMLPEISSNTMDKMMFFASQPFTGIWRSQKETENAIAAELPLFSNWLLNIYSPPEAVLSNEYRGGVRSYFDPHILELGRQQLYAYNLEELLRAWFRVSPYWTDDGNTEWFGSPTDLLTDLSSYDPLKSVSREWTQVKVARALTALAKQENGAVSFEGQAGREFKITRDKV